MLPVRELVFGVLAVATAGVASPALADGNLTFLIDGDTFGVSFTITNSSTNSEKVVGFGVPLKSPFAFDTVNGGFGVDDSAAFDAIARSTGYTGPASFADGATSLAFSFNNFDAGEAFTWYIDVDQPNLATVLGSELIGSTGYADFGNGLRGVGTFIAYGTQGSQFDMLRRKQSVRLLQRGRGVQGMNLI